MILLTRVGVSHSYNCRLRNGHHLEVHSDNSAEVCGFRSRPWSTRGDPRCPTCSANLAPCPVHSVRQVYYSECYVVLRVPRQPTVARALELAAPGVDFGVRPDGSFPVRAYMPYTTKCLYAWPYLATDLPHDTPDELGDPS